MNKELHSASSPLAGRSTEEKSPGRVGTEIHALYARAVALHQSGNLREAALFYQRVLAVEPNHVNSLVNLSAVCLVAGDFTSAAGLVEAALKIDPNQAHAHVNRGILMHTAKRFDDALASFDRAIEIDPGHADACNHRGRVLQDMNRPEDAFASYDHAVSLRPGLADAWNSRGIVLREMGRLEEALLSFERAIALHPGYAIAFNNRGLVLKDLGRLHEALASHDEATARRADYPAAYRNKALLKLALGDYAEGWKLYEWRWKIPAFRESHRHFEQAPWLGSEPVDGKTVLLHAEQGLGDTIHMLRYIPILAARGATVIVAVHSSLIPLAATVQGVSRVVDQGGDLPGFGMHCPFMSLPLALGTTMENIPADVPYLHVPQTYQARWRGFLGEKKGRRIGLVWAGGGHYANDRWRSIGLKSLLPLLDAQDEFHSLQKAYRDGDRELMHGRVEDHSNRLEDFADTAALIEQLDLVITVDTSVAHLAGALGKPVWILLPFSPDFRWLTGRSDSPWYPTARLFRQAAFGNWGEVIERVRLELSRVPE